MLFSFLVPVYNTEKYLKQCVDSLLVQKGAAFEILLLDDGSTDSSPKICDDYAVAYPDLVRVIHKENEGLLMTRRRGFREARGDWFICVDSDDYAAPELLESVVCTIQTHPDCDMVMYNYQYVDDQGAFSPSRLKIQDGMVFSGENKQQLFEMRLTSTVVNNMWMRAVKRSVVDIEADYRSCGIRNMCEDAIQVLPLCENAKKTVYLDRLLYYYRKADGSITSRVTLDHWQAICRSFSAEEAYMERWKVSEPVRCKRYTKQMENICNCVRWLYREKQPALKETIQHIKEISLFSTCLKYYDQQYASSRYSAVSMPVIATAMEREQFRFLHVFFGLERSLRRK